MKILIAARDRGRLAALVQGLGSKGITPVWAGNGAEALSRARQEEPDLAVIADDLGDMSAFALVAGLMTVNAMINTVILSDKDPEAFHEAGEGLGILKQLPGSPRSEDVHSLLTLLTTVRGS